jgi:hypothetical protein
MLEKLFGKVEPNFLFRIKPLPSTFEGTEYHEVLEDIFSKLQKYRGFKDFIKARLLPRCDYFVPDPGIIVEFDESQHFTIPRKITLQNYPPSLRLGFDREKWMRLCDTLRKKDNNPPYRDEQRAWYDTLRDFLPSIKNLAPTIRLFSSDYVWCSLNPENETDVEKFKEILEGANENRSN